ncbi:MAG: hypothetical protein LBM96_02235 [Methanobrevibacter sp.]|jgi:hypothetical protein|nr:hypothetical protein [Candidatus Methanoflexus mossambicus]
MADLDHNTFIAEAEEKGREEEKIDFALKLLNKQFSLIEISELTGLSIEKYRV